MNNSGYDVDGVSIFDVNPIEEAINSNDNTVKTFGNQTISGDKTFTGTVVLENEVIHNSTTFSTEDGIIEQLKGNTGDMLDYGNYAVYNDGVSTKYKGIINKKQTDKFYVFHNQTNQPVSSLNLSTQDLGSLVVREPVEDDEVATKKYIDSHTGGNYLPLSGGTMTGNLDLGNNNMNNVKNINFGDGNLSDQNVIKFDVGNKMTIKTSDNVFVEFNEVNPNKMMIVKTELEMQERIEMNDNKIVELGDGTDTKDAVNKGQLDTKLSLNGGEMDENSTISKLGDLTFRPNNKVKLTYFDDNGVSNAHYTTEVQPFTMVHRTGKNIAFYLDGEFSNVELDPGTGGSTFMTMEESNTKVKIHNLLDMNNKKVVNVANGTATTDAVNKGQLDQGLLNLDIQKLSRTGGTMTGSINFSNGIQMKGDGVAPSTISIGIGAPPNNKGSESISLGSFAGQSNQGIGAVAIGGGAGFGNQGENAIAIGKRAGYTGNNSTTYQASNSIILNATGGFLTTPTENVFIVKPIRNSNTDNNILYYNTTSGEITYGTPSSSGEKYSNTSSTVVNNSNSYTYGTFTFSNIPEGTNGNRPFKIDTFASFTYSASGDDILSMSMDIAYFNASSTQIGSTFTTASSYNPSKTISSTRFITLNNQDIFQFPQGAVKCEVVVFINSTTQITKTGRVILSINDINGI